MTKKEIVKLLNSFKIPIDSWGKGNAKTVDQLLKEVNEGETKFVIKNSKLFRKLKVLHVDVRYKENNIELQLLEDRQELKDGRIRRRELTGVTEKMKPKENYIVGAKRALFEELGIKNKMNIKLISSIQETPMSISYPGLTSNVKTYEMITYLSGKEFKKEGYIEVQSDKSTYFIWKLAI